jgi:hypothetical protein
MDWFHSSVLLVVGAHYTRTADSAKSFSDKTMHGGEELTPRTTRLLFPVIAHVFRLMLSVLESGKHKQIYASRWCILNRPGVVRFNRPPTTDCGYGISLNAMVCSLLNDAGPEVACMLLC